MNNDCGCATQGLAYPYHWGALRPAQSAAYLALQYSALIRTTDPSLSAKLFNYAQFQVQSLALKVRLI